MSETYIGLGPSCGWMYCALGAVYFIVALVPYFVTRRAGRTSGMFMALAGLFVLAGLIQMPVALLFTCMFLLMPIAGYLSSKGTMPRPGLAVLLCMSVAAGAFMFFMMSDEKIVLTDTTLIMQPRGLLAPSQSPYHRGALPRNAVRIDASLFHDTGWEAFASAPETYSWDVYQDRGTGPHFEGSAFFWGPHGLTRGNTVGKRIAEWSGRSPDYKSVE